MGVVDTPLTMPGKKFTEDAKVHLANAGALEEFAKGIYTSLMPVGVVLPYTGTIAPTGYLLCDGQAVSRTTYITLFTVIGTAFGSGDGSITFNVPDMQSESAITLRFPIGAGIGNSLGVTESTYTLTSTAAEAAGQGVTFNWIIKT